MNTKKFISVRLKIIIIILLSVVALSALMYFVTNTLLLKSYRFIEKNQTIQNVERANDALFNIVTQLDLRLADWAWWDDTYKFVLDKNQDYIDSNLGTTSMSNIGINTMVFMDQEGKISFKKTIDINKKIEVSSDSIEQYIKKQPNFVISKTDSKIKGIILLPEGPMLISVLPILNSNSEGPIRGTLLFGKYLDNDLISTIGDLTHLSINFYKLDGSLLPNDVAIAKENMLESGLVYTSPLSDASVGGYLLLKDINNIPALILKIDTPREVYSQGLRTFYSFLIIAGIATTMFGLIIIILIEVFFISRFSKLSKKIEHIGETKDFSERIAIDNKKDEFGMLSNVINKVLDTLSVALESEKQSSKKAILNEQQLNERMQEFEALNKLMVGRELKMVELKKEISDLKESKSIINNS